MQLRDLVAADLPPLLSVDEAIERGLIRSSRPRAYEDVRSGALPSIRSGRRVWLPTAALLRRLGLDAESPSEEGLPTTTRTANPPVNERTVR